MSNFMKIRPVGAELFHADGRTDMTKLTVAYSNFEGAKKMASIVLCILSEVGTSCCKE